MVDYLGFDSMQSAKALRDEYFQRHGTILLVFLAPCYIAEPSQPNPTTPPGVITPR